MRLSPAPRYSHTESPAGQTEAPPPYINNDAEERATATGKQRADRG